MTENGNGRKKLEAQVYALLLIGVALLGQLVKDMTGMGSQNKTSDRIAETNATQVEILKGMSEKLDTLILHDQLIRETYGYGPDKIAEAVTRRMKEGEK